MGQIGKGNGQQWQIDFTELTRKGEYRYLLVLTNAFSGWPEAFPTTMIKLERCSLLCCKTTGDSYSEWKRNQLR